MLWGVGSPFVLGKRKTEESVFNTHLEWSVALNLEHLLQREEAFFTSDGN